MSEGEKDLFDGEGDELTEVDREEEAAPPSSHRRLTEHAFGELIREMFEPSLEAPQELKDRLIAWTQATVEKNGNGMCNHNIANRTLKVRTALAVLLDLRMFFTEEGGGEQNEGEVQGELNDGNVSPSDSCVRLCSDVSARAQEPAPSELRDHLQRLTHQTLQGVVIRDNDCDDDPIISTKGKGTTVLGKSRKLKANPYGGLNPRGFQGTLEEMQIYLEQQNGAHDRKNN